MHHVRDALSVGRSILHPVSCDFKDALHEMCRILGQADNLTIITENYYGGYSPNVKDC